jgi:hypothetical protein
MLESHKDAMFKTVRAHREGDAAGDQHRKANMLSNKILSSAFGLALIAGVAGASPGEYERHEYYEHRGPMPFEVVDLNQDGVVTADEHAQVRSERHSVRAQQGYPMRNAGSAPSFEQMDSDGNGSISREELADFQALRMQQRQGMSRR